VVTDTTNQMLYFVVVGTLANGAFYQSAESTIPLLGNFSITNIMPTSPYSININIPTPSVSGTTYTVSYKIATNTNYTTVGQTFTSSPISLNIGPTGLNLFNNVAYYFQVTASNTGTNANPVSVVSNTPFWYRTPSPLGVSAVTTYYVNSLGNLYGWGYSASDLLTSAVTTNPQISPFQITNTQDGIMATAGTYQLFTTGAACFLKNNYQLYCAGYNETATAGQGSTNSITYPTFGPVWANASGTSFLSNVVSFTMGAFQTCALDSSQQSWCWGNNQFGQLQQTNYALNQPYASVVPDTNTYLALGSGEYHVCGLRNDQTIWCWGYGQEGQTGYSDGYAGGNPIPSIIQDLEGNNIDDFVDISIGHRASCGLRANGSPWCWGSGENGGVTGLTNVYTDVIAVQSAVNNGGCALRQNGSVWCWGGNNNGLMGLPISTTSVATATQIQSWTDVQSLSLGSEASHGCVIRQDSLVNSVWCWGRDDYGQLGAGSSPTPGFTPTPINTQTPANTPTSSLTPSASPAGGSSPSATPSHSPTASTSPSPNTSSYQYTPQYVAIPVM
jgi:alpha-tubulin suppressor-like RCC1 family protein